MALIIVSLALSLPAMILNHRINNIAKRLEALEVKQ